MILIHQTDTQEDNMSEQKPHAPNVATSFEVGSANYQELKDQLAKSNKQ